MGRRSLRFGLRLRCAASRVPGWRGRRLAVEDRRVGTDGQLDADGGAGGGVLGRGLIVLLEAPADFTGLHAHHGVVSGGVARRPLKDFRADGAFFEFFLLAGETMFHHVTQELLTAAGVQEVSTGQDAFELTKNGLPARLFQFRLGMSGFASRRWFNKRFHSILTGILKAWMKLRSPSLFSGPQASPDH